MGLHPRKAVAGSGGRSLRVSALAEPVRRNITATALNCDSVDNGPGTVEAQKPTLSPSL